MKINFPIGIHMRPDGLWMATDDKGYVLFVHRDFDTTVSWVKSFTVRSGPDLLDRLMLARACKILGQPDRW